MKKMLPVITVLLLGLVLWSTCTRKAPTKIEWAASLEDALKMAAEKNTPIIADFWSEG